MQVETSRFGTIEVDEKSIIRMPRGPIGFEGFNDYVIVEHRPDTEFRWMQSTEDPTLAFVVIDPSKFFAEYEIEISDADAEKLKLTNEKDATVLVIVSIANAGKEVTANLAAPVVINSQDLTGMQIILQDNRYPVRHALVNTAENTSQERERTTVKAA